MELLILKDIVIVFGLAMAVILVCKQLRIPTLVALLITGVISGPNALGIIKDAHEVAPLAELGIAFLLFSIGIELSLKRFLRGMRQILLGGGMQVGLTLAAGTGVALCLGRPAGEALFLGCLLSLSSTAIVVTLLQERNELNTPSGNLSLSVLIFQDIIVVPMMLVVPLLAGSPVTVDTSFWFLIVQSAGILASVLLAGHWLVPKLLHLVALTKDTRLFLMTVLFICFSVAWLTASLGLSFAFGAFLAGLIISESEYNYHTLGNIFPFQEIFTCFFFVSTGMLLDGGFVLQHPFLIAGCVIAIATLKACTAGISVLMMGYPLATALVTGITLCQVGEFSFLLVKSGIEHSISTPFHYQLFLAATLLSMALTPMMVKMAPQLVGWLQDRGWLPAPKHTRFDDSDEEPLTNHVVIVGFGAGGRNLAYSLKMAGVPYVILETDADIVRRERMKSEPIAFGDASHTSVLTHANLKSARVLTVVISDEGATRRIITSARRANPDLYIIVRTRRISEIKRLMSLGANEVVPEELEASIEVFTRVLRKCLVPSNEIEKVSRELRSSEYEMFREPFLAPIKFSDLNLDLAEMEIDTIRIDPESPLVGRTIRQIAFRSTYGVTVLVLRRFGKIQWEIDPDMALQGNDVLALFGHHKKVQQVAEYFGGEDNLESP